LLKSADFSAQVYNLNEFIISLTRMLWQIVGRVVIIFFEHKRKKS